MLCEQLHQVRHSAYEKRDLLRSKEASAGLTEKSAAMKFYLERSPSSTEDAIAFGGNEALRHGEIRLRNERIVVSRQRLLDEVWGYDPFSITNTIEVFVSNLRRKLEADGEPRILHTIRGAGYVLRV